MLRTHRIGVSESRPQRGQRPWPNRIELVPLCAHNWPAGKVSANGTLATFSHAPVHGKGSRTLMQKPPKARHVLPRPCPPGAVLAPSSACDTLRCLRSASSFLSRRRSAGGRGLRDGDGTRGNTRRSALLPARVFGGRSPAAARAAPFRQASSPGRFRSHIPRHQRVT